MKSYIFTIGIGEKFVNINVSEDEKDNLCNCLKEGKEWRAKDGDTFVWVDKKSLTFYSQSVRPMEPIDNGEAK